MAQPLTDAETERLSAVLERFGDKRSMNLEQLDGFLAALGRVLINCRQSLADVAAWPRYRPDSGRCGRSEILPTS
jgi:hypothetical protein